MRIGDIGVWITVIANAVLLICWWQHRKHRCGSCKEILREPGGYCMRCGEPPKGKLRNEAPTVIERGTLLSRYKALGLVYIIGLMLVFVAVLSSSLDSGSKMLVLVGVSVIGMMAFLLAFKKSSSCQSCGHAIYIAEVKEDSECYCVNCGAHVIPGADR